jgi:hypothetical protein
MEPAVVVDQRPPYILKEDNMRTLRSFALPAVLAVIFSAMFATAAHAVLPEFLDGTLAGLKFTGESGKSEVLDPSNKTSLKCTKDKLSGEVTGAKTIKATIDFEGCKESGFPVNSLGDPKELVLVPVSGELCFLKEAPVLEVGMFFKLPAEGVHAEDPLLGVLEAFKGTFIGTWEFINVLQALQDISMKQPNIKECGGKKAELVLELEHNGKPLLNEIESFEEIHFEKDIEVMG